MERVDGREGLEWLLEMTPEFPGRTRRKEGKGSDKTDTWERRHYLRTIIKQRLGRLIAVEQAQEKAEEAAKARREARGEEAEPTPQTGARLGVGARALAALAIRGAGLLERAGLGPMGLSARQTAEAKRAQGDIAAIRDRRRSPSRESGVERR